MAGEFKDGENKKRPGIYRRYVNIGDDDERSEVDFGLKAVAGPPGNITVYIYGGTLLASENSGKVTLSMAGGELVALNSGNGNTEIRIGG